MRDEGTTWIPYLYYTQSMGNYHTEKNLNSNHAFMQIAQNLFSCDVFHTNTQPRSCGGSIYIGWATWHIVEYARILVLLWFCTPSGVSAYIIGWCGYDTRTALDEFLIRWIYVKLLVAAVCVWHKSFSVNRLFHTLLAPLCRHSTIFKQF